MRPTFSDPGIPNSVHDQKTLICLLEKQRGLLFSRKKIVSLLFIIWSRCLSNANDEQIDLAGMYGHH